MFSLKCLAVGLNQGLPCVLPLEGIPHEILAMDFWVPGSTTRQELDRFKGKAQFKEILTTTKQSVMMYFSRATQDFSLKPMVYRSWVFPFCLLLGICNQPCKDFIRKVGKDATTKTKELGQNVKESYVLENNRQTLMVGGEGRMW